MSEPRPLDYETPGRSRKQRRPKTGYWFLFYMVFVLLSVWMAISILSATDVTFFYCTFGMLGQVVVWVLTSRVHRNPEHPADDMNSIRKILLGLGMAVCLLSLFLRFLLPHAPNSAPVYNLPLR